MKMPLIKTDRKLSKFLPFLLKVAKFDKFQNNQKAWFLLSSFQGMVVVEMLISLVDSMIDGSIDLFCAALFSPRFFFNLTFGEGIL